MAVRASSSIEQQKLISAQFWSQRLSINITLPKPSTTPPGSLEETVPSLSCSHVPVLVAPSHQHLSVSPHGSQFLSVSLTFFCFSFITMVCLSVCLCVSVCVCICASVCMCLCPCEYMYMSLCVFMHLCWWVCTNVFLWVFVYMPLCVCLYVWCMCMSIWVRMYVPLCVCVCLCVCLSIWVSVYVSMWVPVNVPLCICLCVCMYDVCSHVCLGEPVSTLILLSPHPHHISGVRAEHTGIPISVNGCWDPNSGRHVCTLSHLPQPQEPHSKRNFLDTDKHSQFAIV